MTGTGYLDSHCHLQKKSLAPDLDKIIEKADKSSVNMMFCNATQEDDWQAVVNMATGQPGIVPFLGIHPWYVETATTGWDKRLMSQLLEIPAGIGETGLDKCCRADFNRQQQIFMIQLKMASELKRPLVIHCVKAWGRLLEILEQFTEPLPPIMLHAFGGSRETLQRLLRFGCFISFASKLTINSTLHSCFLATPLANLLLETDSQKHSGVTHSINGEKKIDAEVAGVPEKPDRYPPLGSYSPNNHKMVYDGSVDIIRLYQWAATMREMDLDKFCQQIWKNGEIFTNTIIPR
jgi:TatD DNase family protein